MTDTALTRKHLPALVSILIAVSALGACGAASVGPSLGTRDANPGGASGDAGLGAGGWGEIPGAAVDGAAGSAGSLGRDAGPDGVDSGSGLGADSGEGGANSDARAAGDRFGEAGATDSNPVLAATPPMGWNSWNTFECDYDEALIKEVADAFVSTGMKAVGYQYVNIDDCWMDGRDASGKLKWNAKKFPSGIPALASYVHGLGLKFGIYQAANAFTCVSFSMGVPASVAVGSLGHEAEDAAIFAAWGVDFLKYDLCRGDRKSFAPMGAALRATGRPIVYSMNAVQFPDAPGWNPGSIANMWRISPDITLGFGSVMGIVALDLPFARFAGPGHWNDADMLEVGRGMTEAEDRTHFGMWALLASPLIAGNDVRSMSAATRAILTNPDVIAVDQDPLGQQAALVSDNHAGLQVYSKVLAGTNTRAVGLLNRSASPATIRVTWSNIGLPTGAARVRDLWTQKEVGSFVDGYSVAVESHGIALLRISSP